MSIAKKILAPLVAASLALIAAPAVAQTPHQPSPATTTTTTAASTTPAQANPTPTLTYAQIYQPTTRAEVKQAGPDGRKFDFVVDNGPNNGAIASVELVHKAGVTPSASYPLGGFEAGYENGKLTGRLQLKPEAIYPAQFYINYRLMVTYTDKSFEYIEGRVLVEPLPTLVKC